MGSRSFADMFRAAGVCVPPGVRSRFALRNDPRTGPQKGPHARECRAAIKDTTVKDAANKKTTTKTDASYRRLAIDQVTRAMLAVGLTHQRTGPQTGPQARRQGLSAEDAVAPDATTNDAVVK